MSQRRIIGGARRESTERVVLAEGETKIEGWTLNESRGGLRVVIEDEVFPGADYLVSVGELAARPATVVWVREEADGRIAGLAYTDVDGSVPSSVS
ncbi:MAG: PilZ domain-containing protein [Polyangiaceae bacterium]|nr:PilZ domain-containing protein [Polyangiaceae bacterium]